MHILHNIYRWFCYIIIINLLATQHATMVVYKLRHNQFDIILYTTVNGIEKDAEVVTHQNLVYRVPLKQCNYLLMWLTSFKHYKYMKF